MKGTPALSLSLTRVSIICLAAQAHVHSRIVRESGGTLHAVPRDVGELRSAMLTLLAPPPTTASPTPTLLPVSFPTTHSLPHPLPCTCHSLFVSLSLTCPRCGAVNCEVGGGCGGCGRPLLSSPHLAASAYARYPPPPAVPLEGGWREEREREALGKRRRRDGETEGEREREGGREREGEGVCCLFVDGRWCPRLAQVYSLPWNTV